MNIVTIGGGGGHAQVLKGLKTIDNLTVTGICPVTDSGGSTGKLTEEYNGLGYLGDLTKCIVALSPNPTLAEALLYRYKEGCLHGHSVKNILLLALEQITDHNSALEIFLEICQVRPHRVIPVSRVPSQLCAKLKIGTMEGETNIDLIAQNPLWHPDIHAIEDIYLKPEIRADDTAVRAISEANWVVICPGDLYSSILPVLLPNGIKESIINSDAKIIIVMNIMTKQGETDNYTSLDFIHQIERRLGRKCDAILCNTSPIPEERMFEYTLEGKTQLLPPVEEPRVFPAELLETTNKGELYHNPTAVARALQEIFWS